MIKNKLKMVKLKIIFLFFLSLRLCKNDIRNLFEEEEIQKICSKCQSDFNQTYLNEELINSTKDNDKINDYVIKLVESLKNDSANSSDIYDEYVFPRFIVPNIIYIILTLLIIIFYLAIIIISCIDHKKKCLSKKCFNDKNHNIFSYITILLCIITIIISSLILFHINKSKIYFNSSICALLRIYLDVRDGDQAHSTSWVGIKQLQEDLVGDKSLVGRTMKTINLQEKVTEKLKNNKYEKNTFDEEEKNNNYFSESSVNSPNTLINKVFPSYSKNRKEFLGKITLEYTLKLKHGIEINEQISFTNKLIKNNPELISKDYLFVNQKLNDMLETIQISAEEYLQLLIDYTKYVNNIAFPILISIFSLLIFFSASISIFLFLHIFCNNILKKISKIFMNIFWNVLFILLILVVISQIIFKIFQLFSIDGSGIMQYATSEENFKSSDSIIFRGAGTIFLEMCFKDNEGNLLANITSKMDRNQSRLNELNNIYLSEIVYGPYYEIIKQTELNETENILNDLKNMYNDYSLISYYENNLLSIETNCQYDLDELTKYTDYSNPLISYQKPGLNNSHTYDVWTSKSINCNNYKNYKYINNEKDRTDGNKYCLVIEEFNPDIAKNFYSNIQTINPLQKTVDVIFYEYHQSLTKFEEDNKKLLYNEPSNFIYRTNSYYNDLISVKEDILTGIDYSRQIAILLNDIMRDPFGIYFGIDFISIMNCRFLKRDLKVFYIQMEKLRQSSNTLLKFNIIEMIPVLICTIIILIIKYKNKYKNDGNNSGNIEEINDGSTNIQLNLL